MKPLHLRSVVTLLILTVSAAASWGANDIQLVSKAQKETVTVTKNGTKETKLVPTEKVVPGDVIVYTNQYRNTGKEPATDAVINNPVPKHMSYIADSAFGEGAVITYSVNHGKSFDVPENLFKTTKGKKRPARPDEYTDIRWTFKSVPAGKEGTVGFKARLR